MHDYLPDFIIRSQAYKDRHLILEVKGYDPLEEVKTAAALPWVNAVNSDGRYGSWRYGMIRNYKTYETKTDEDGIFEIYDLPPGKYFVEPETPGLYKNCPKVDEILAKNRSNNVTVKSNVVKLTTDQDVFEVELTLPFPRCEKAQR